MSKGSVIAIVTQGDPRIGRIVQPVILGLDHIRLVKFWSHDDLSGLDGDCQYPLTLVGHANQSNFVETYRTNDKVSGTQVARDLLSAGLEASSFPFCLIAGCNAAESYSDSALYAQVAEKLQIPTVSSTTSVAMIQQGGYIDLKPQDSGVWKVYDPSVEVGNPTFLLDSDAPLSIIIRAILCKYVFRPVAADCN